MCTSPFPTSAGIQLRPYPMTVTVIITNMYKPSIELVYKVIQCGIESYGKCVCVCVCVWVCVWCGVNSAPHTHTFFSPPYVILVRR